jgi:hypothetical protein
MQTPSERLAHFIVENKFTIPTFAARVKANRSQVYRLVMNERCPSVDLAAAIEEATGGSIRATDWAGHVPIRRRSVSARKSPARGRVVRSRASGAPRKPAQGIR